MTPIEPADDEGPAPKSIGYCFEKADLRALAVICNRGWAARSTSSAMWTIIFVGICMAAGGWPMGARDWIVLIAIGGIGFAIMFALYPRLMAASVLTKYRHLAVADKSVAIGFGADGMEASVNGTQSYVPWENFIGRVETADRIFLKLGRYEAITVPRRAFADDHQFQATLMFLRRKVAGTAR